MYWHKLLGLCLKDLVRYLLDPLDVWNGSLVTDYDPLVTPYILSSKGFKNIS